MDVYCEKCGRWYDDAARWTICPHNNLAVKKRTRGGYVRIGLLITYSAFLLPLLLWIFGNSLAHNFSSEGSHRIAKPLYGLKTVPRVRIPPAPLCRSKLLDNILLLISWLSPFDGLAQEVAC
jgi:hypothetical protein